MGPLEAQVVVGPMDQNKTPRKKFGQRAAMDGLFCLL